MKIKLLEQKAIPLRYGQDYSFAKRALGSWKDTDSLLTAKEVISQFRTEGKFPRFGITPPDGSILIDVDNEYDEAAFERVIAGIPIVKWKTNKGTHYLFKQSDECASLIKAGVIKNNAKVHTICGIEVDIRLPRVGYACIALEWKENGSSKKAMRWTSDNIAGEVELLPLPSSLLPVVQGWTDKINHPDRTSSPATCPDGKGHDWRIAFFGKFNSQYEGNKSAYINTREHLLGVGYKTLCERCWESPDTKWKGDFNDSCKPVKEKFVSKPAQKVTGRGVQAPKGPSEQEVALKLIEEYKIRIINEVMYIEHQNAYRLLKPAALTRLVYGKLGNLYSASKLDGIIKFINNISPLQQACLKAVIVFKNGTYYIDEKRFEAGVYEPMLNVIPHNYNPNAENEDLNNLLDAIANGEPAKRIVIEEVMAAILYPYSGTVNPKTIWLVGSGSDGKSTLFRMIQYAIGKENYSSSDVNGLSGQFGLSNIVGKMAMLTPDASLNINKDSEVFKKVSSNDDVTVDIKGSQMIQHTPNITMVFGINGIPNIRDGADSMGALRRFKLIQLTKKFIPGSDGYDPFISKRLTSPEVAEALLNLAVNRLHELIGRGFEYTETESEKTMLKEYQLDVDNVLCFLDDILTGGKVSAGVTDFYRIYSNYCADSGYNRMSRRNFYKRIDAHKEDFKIEVRNRNVYIDEKNSNLQGWSGLDEIRHPREGQKMKLNNYQGEYYE